MAWRRPGDEQASVKIHSKYKTFPFKKEEKIENIIQIITLDVDMFNC